VKSNLLYFFNSVVFNIPATGTQF